MGHHHGGEPLLPHNFVREKHNHLGGFGVQSRRVLIQNQKAQGRHGGHQQRRRLPLPTGEGPHFHVQLILQPQPQALQLGAVPVDALFVHAPAKTEGLPLVVRKRQVFQHGQIGARPHGRILVHPPHGGIALKVLFSQNALARHQHVSALHGDGPADNIQ
ncbi:hypothetical protein SDC9_72246 [bioreactor metagenome]|uniref:Uncharacterized protein n=1 Tax=bioreactor metagenome TaxID=1076179 RepID=A0A644YB19_9ZZZZ